MLVINEMVAEFTYVAPNHKTGIYSKYTYGMKKQDVEKRLALLLKEYHGNEFDEYEFYYAVKSAVMGWTNDKMHLINFYRCFERYINDTYAFNLKCPYPPIDISKAFERMMYMAKELQSSSKTVADIAEELWISERTAEEDYKKLSGVDSENVIQVCGKPFTITEMARSNRDGTVNFGSTVHPIFLTFNITQVIATLKGLKEVSQDKLMERYAIGSALAIWTQLSNYARERILHVTEQLTPDEYAWYKALDEAKFAGDGYEINNHFVSEYEFTTSSNQGPNAVLDCIKNEKICVIEYLNEDGSTSILSDCKVLYDDISNHTVKILCDGAERILDIDRILRSALSVDRLI